MRVNFHIFSGVYRPQVKLTGRKGPYVATFPTLVIDASLADWALPLSWHNGGPLLGKPGVTVRFLCFNIGWSKL